MTFIDQVVPVVTGRGPLSSLVVEVLTGAQDSRALREVPAPCGGAGSAVGMVQDEDLQLALFLLYSPAYGSLGPAVDALEWDPDLLGLRARLEDRLEGALRELVGQVPAPAPVTREVAAALFQLTEADTGPSLSRFAAKHATAEQLRELLVVRSIYTLREADPHSWAIPRLTGRAKAALV